MNYFDHYFFQARVSLSRSPQSVFQVAGSLKCPSSENEDGIFNIFIEANTEFYLLT